MASARGNEAHRPTDRLTAQAFWTQPHLHTHTHTHTMLIEEVLEDGTIETLTPLGDAMITCVHEKHSGVLSGMPGSSSGSAGEHIGAIWQPLRLEFKGHIPHAIHRQPLPPAPLPPAPLLVSLDAPRSTALLGCSRTATPHGR